MTIANMVVEMGGKCGFLCFSGMEPKADLDAVYAAEWEINLEEVVPYSQKGKISNLKEMNETFNYLRANGIYTLEDLESHVKEPVSYTHLRKCDFLCVWTRPKEQASLCSRCGR